MKSRKILVASWALLCAALGFVFLVDSVIPSTFYVSDTQTYKVAINPDIAGIVKVPETTALEDTVASTSVPEKITDTTISNSNVAPVVP